MRTRPVPFTEPDWEEKEAQRISELPFFTDYGRPSRNQLKRQVTLLARRLAGAPLYTSADYDKAFHVVERAVEIQKGKTQ